MKRLLPPTENASTAAPSTSPAPDRPRHAATEVRSGQRVLRTAGVMLQAAALLGLQAGGSRQAWAQAPTPPAGTPGAPGGNSVTLPTTGPSLDPSTVDNMRREGVRLNFEDVDIKVLARIISQITGRAIVLDQKAQGKITVTSSRIVTPDEAWDMFAAALEAYGFGLEEDQGFYRISPIANARAKQARLYPNGKARVLVAVIKLERVPADQMVNTLRPLLTPAGVVTGYAGSNSIVVADDATVVKRMMALARKIDLSSKKPMLRIFYPKRVRARDVARNIESLFPDRQAIKISVHEATNSLMVLATPDQQAYIERLLNSLERREQIQAEPREFFVFYLQHAQAEELAKTLGEMLTERQRIEKGLTESGISTAQSSSGTGLGSPQPPPAPAEPSSMPIVPGPGPSQALPWLAQGPAAPRGRVGTPASPASAGSFQSGAATVPGASATGAVATQVSQSTFASQKVSADVPNNALVFYMPRSEYGIVRKLVEQLDIPRKQVLVSAVIAEVTLEKVAKAGINWQGVSKYGGLFSFGGGLSQTQLLGILQSNSFVFGGVDPTKTTVSSGSTSVSFPNNFALLQFLESGNDFNLISSPRLLTHNNKEADIKVGQVTPFATGARFDINGQPIINFDYREVGLDLKLTPHISQGENVRLELKQKLQEVIAQQTQGVGAASFTVPVVSNREVNTEVSLIDGQTLIIGGLVSKRTLKDMRKVPILGDLPGVGQLFRVNNDDTTKTTLFIFITPHIIDSPQKLRDLTQQYDRLMEPSMKAGVDASRRQDFTPRVQGPEPVIDPQVMPLPRTAPFEQELSPESPLRDRALPPGSPAPAPHDHPARDAEPPGSSRTAPRNHPGPPRPDANPNTPRF